MQDPWNTTEFARAEMADGRVLLIARERAPRITRPGQILFNLACAMAAAMIPLLLSPFLPLLLFAGLWSGVPLILAYTFAACMMWKRASDWARTPPEDPPVCKIVGGSVTTDELLNIMRDGTAGSPNIRSVH